MNMHQKEIRETRKRIGQNIHEIRRSKKITLKKLSRLSGVNIDMLDQYELGKNNLQVESLIKIACGLGINAEALWRN